MLDQRVFKLTPQFVSYTLAKSALHAATRMLAQALAPKVRVNAVAPGPTAQSARQLPEDFARQAAAVPLGRGSSPQEIAAAVVYLARRAQRDRRDARGRRRPASRVADAGCEHDRMSDVQSSEDVDFDSEVPVLIIGAGAAGLCAALAASEAGVEPVVIERDAVPSGSTALSAGLIPAAGTRFQAARGVADSPELFAADISRKAHGEADAKLVRAVAQGAGPTVEWLADAYALPFEVITDFNYPGHSAHRMHGLPSRTGAELIDYLRSAAEARGIPILGRALPRRCSPTRTASSKASGSGAATARARPSAAARWCSPATAMAATRPWCGGTSPKWPMRSTSAIPAIRATPCCGARHSARGSGRSPAIRGTARSRRRTTS